MSSKNSKQLLEKLTDANFALSRVIFASQTQAEGFSKSYLDDKESFNKMISSGVKMERLLNRYFKDLAVHVIQNINWDAYIDRIILAAEPNNLLVLYRGGNSYDWSSDSYGVSTSMSPAAARAYAKSSGANSVSEISISPTAKIKTVDSKGLGIDSLYNYQDLQKLHTQGYDAVQDISSTIEREVRILNPSVIVNTRVIDLNATPPPQSNDLWGSTIDFDGQKLNLSITFNNGMYDAFGAGIEAAQGEIGIATRILPTDAPAIKAFREYGLDEATKIIDTTKDRIKESLITSMKQGLTKNQAGDEIAKIIADPARARIIAHTEQVISYSKGRQTVGDEVGARWKIWDNGQPKACSICSGLHGSKVRWNDQFSGGYDYPPAHPNCYCGWHMVL